MDNSLIYLDHAATTPLRSGVLDVMQRHLTGGQLNPSAMYARDVQHERESCRQHVANVLQCKPHEIIFTTGATESNNIFIQGLMRAHPDTRVLISSIEHDSVRSVAEKYDHDYIPMTKDGVIDMKRIPSLVDDRTILLSVMYVNNEVGVLMPLRKIASIVEDIRQDRYRRGVNTPLYFHSDAAQAVYQKLNVHALGLDGMTMNGSKIGAPKQSGFLYISKDISINPILFGGGQERSLRPGTEAMHQIAGFTHAFLEANRTAKDESIYIRNLQQKFEADLITLGAQVVADNVQRSPHITNALFVGHDNEMLANQLALKGIYVGVGSACHAASSQASHVLRALDYSEEEAQSSLRFSYSASTLPQELSQVISTLRELL